MSTPDTMLHMPTVEALCNHIKAHDGEGFSKEILKAREVDRSFAMKALFEQLKIAKQPDDFLPILRAALPACSPQEVHTRFLEIVAWGSVGMVDVFLQHCDYVDYPLCESLAANKHYHTPLMFASRYGRIDIAKRLIENGANPNFLDGDGENALFWAAASSLKYELVDIVRFLCENGADPTIKNFRGNTPLHFVLLDFSSRPRSIKPIYEMAETLVEYGAQLDAVDNEGFSPMQMVQSPELADLLQSIMDRKKLESETPAAGCNRALRL